MKIRPNLFVIQLCVALFFLTGCRGGGGGSGESANPSSLNNEQTYVVKGQLDGDGDLSAIPVYLVAAMANIPPVNSGIRGSVQPNVGGQLYVTLTDASGGFVFSEVTAGTYNLIAQKDRFSTAIHRDLLINASVAAPVDLKLKLTPTGNITGNITVPAGSPATSGVIAFVTGTSFAAFSDTQGNFTISGVPVGTYTMCFMATGLTQVQVQNVSVGAGLTTTLPMVSLSKDASFFVGIIWKGALPVHPTDPDINWAYFNTADGKSYIWDGFTWQILAQSGATGTPGSGIAWMGSSEIPPANPKTNWAYYNSALKQSFIYDGTAWKLLVQDGLVGPQGPVGPKGDPGISIVWKGTFAAPPASPQTNWAYYNSTDRKSYIWDGVAWSVLAESIVGPTGPQGPAGLSIVWQGTLTAHPANPQLNWAYYNSVDRKSYIFDGTAWQILAQDGVQSSSLAILAVTAVKDSNSSFHVLWKTNQEALVRVEYGTDTNYGQFSAWQEGYSNGIHSDMPFTDGSFTIGYYPVPITGLTPANPHHYRLWAKDTNGLATFSQDYTIDITPPVVSNVATGSTTVNSMVVTWNTDETSNSVVEYGTTAAYGQTQTAGTQVTNHSVTLTGLTSWTLYHFRVKSTDASGNEVVSGDFTAKTLPTLSDGLVAYYPFTGTANDTSGSGHNGTVVGGVTLANDRFGNSNSAYSFDGNYGASYIQVPQSAGLDLQEHSVCAWVKWMGNDTFGHNFGGIFSNGYNVDHYALVGGGTMFRSFENYPSSSANEHMFNTTALANHGFHFLVTTYDGTSQKLWLDGSLVSTSAFSEAIDYSTPENCYMGVDFPGGYDSFNGIIDDVRVYGRSLSSTEIQTLFNTPSPADLTAPVISAVAASSITTSTAVITWTTDENSTSLVEYGTTTAYGSIASVPGSVTNHSVTITGLTTGTTYHYRVRSADSVDNQSTSPASFETKADWEVEHSIDANTIALWHFNEGSGGTTEDSSGNGFQGTLNGPSWTTSGKFGNALSFASNGKYVQLPDSSTWDTIATFTMEAWLYPTSLPAAGDTRVFFARHNSYDNDAWEYRLLGLATGSVFNCGLTGASQVGSSVLDLAPVQTNRWYHVAVTWDTRTLRLLVDGQEVGAATTSFSSFDNLTYGPRIGWYDSAFNNGFDGIIDEVRISNIVRY